MTPRHLSCRDCRIRILANAPGIGLLEGGCPICGVTLKPVSSAQDVMGFRWFDLDAFSDGALSGAQEAVGRPLDGSASFRSEAVAQWPAPC